jgi:hypothetical protein
MGIKNAVNVEVRVLHELDLFFSLSLWLHHQVDVDPKTGTFNPQPIVDRIKAENTRVGKQKVSAPPKPKVWSYKPPENEQERDDNLAAFESALDKGRFSEGDLLAWELLTSDQKDFMWAVWRLFAEDDARLPLHR